MACESSPPLSPVKLSEAETEFASNGWETSTAVHDRENEVDNSAYERGISLEALRDSSREVKQRQFATASSYRRGQGHFNDDDGYMNTIEERSEKDNGSEERNSERNFLSRLSSELSKSDEASHDQCDDNVSLEGEEYNRDNDKVLTDVVTEQNLDGEKDSSPYMQNIHDEQKVKSKTVRKNSGNPHGNDDDADESDYEEKSAPFSTSRENIRDVAGKNDSKVVVVNEKVNVSGCELPEMSKANGSDDIDGHNEDSIRLPESTKSQSEGIAAQSRFINVKAELESALARRLESDRHSDYSGAITSADNDSVDGSFETRTAGHDVIRGSSNFSQSENETEIQTHPSLHASSLTHPQDYYSEEKAQVKNVSDHRVRVVTYAKFQRDTASFTTRSLKVPSSIATTQNSSETDKPVENSISGQPSTDSFQDSTDNVANFHVESEIQHPKSPTRDRSHSPPPKDQTSFTTHCHIPRLSSIEELENVVLDDTDIETEAGKTNPEQYLEKSVELADDKRNQDDCAVPALVDVSNNNIETTKATQNQSSHQETAHSTHNIIQDGDLDSDRTDLYDENTFNSSFKKAMAPSTESVVETTVEMSNQAQTTDKKLPATVEIENERPGEAVVDTPATAAASTSAPAGKEIPKKPQRKKLSKRRSDLSIKSEDRSMTSADIDLITPWESQDYDFVRGKLRPTREELEREAEEYIRERVNQWVESGKGRKEPRPPLSERRVLHREKLLTQKTVKSSGFILLKNTKRKRVKQFSNLVENISYTFALWGKSIRAIEGCHGAGVASYFLFLRWLFGLNILLFILMTSFVIIPMGLIDENPLTPSTNTVYNTSYYCSQNYTVIEGSGITVLLEFIQGTGWMEKTVLFYGYYANGLDSSYNLPLAYVLTVLVCLMVSLGLMARYTGSSFKEALLNETNTNFEYSNKIFGAWDYSLTDPEAAELRQKGIHYDVQSDMLEQNFMRKRVERLENKCSMCKLYFMRLLINFIIILSLGGAAYLIYYVTHFSTEYASDNEDASGAESWLLLLVQYLPSITITACNAILPLMFEKIVELEDYSQAFVIKLTLVRTVFLRLASMIVLVITMYTEITCSSQNSCRATLEPDCTDIKCWETYVGQQFYKLVIMDFLVTVVKVLAVELPRKLLYEKCTCGLMQAIGPPEFNIPANVLDLVYAQCLLWLGFLFTPLLPGLVVIKCFIVFYAKKLSALVACPPSEKPYKASRINTFFMIILLMAYFLCALPIIFAIFGISPSRGCGPFRVLDYMNEAIKNTVESWPSVLSSSYGFITSAAVTGTIIVLLCMALYYQKNMSAAHRQKAELYKEQLIMEGRDKQFLLSKLQDIYASPGKKNPQKDGKKSKPEDKMTNVNEKSKAQKHGDGSFSPPNVVDNGDW